MFEELIDSIISKCNPKNELGWLLDAEHFFCENKSWLASSADFADEPRYLLELKALLAPSVGSFKQLRNIMREVWGELCWSNFEASAINEYREASVLKFITVARGGSSSMTGRMLISGAHYFELVRRNENHLHRRLPTIPFEVDFSNLDPIQQSFSQLSEERAEKDWDDDKLLIPEILSLLKRVEHCVLHGKGQFLASEISQDALRYNLEALARTTSRVSFHRTDIAEWRHSLLKIAHPANKPWNQDPEFIWEAVQVHVLKLLPIIEQYRRAYDGAV